jgi:tetratricopeptide (TPR) repeat protein
MGDIDTQRLDWRQALVDYERARDLQPQDEKTRSILIDLNYRLNRSTAALDELNDYANQLEGQDPERLLKFTAGILQEHVEHAELHRFYADHLRTAGRLKEAAAEYDRAGDLYLSQGNQEAAATVIETILTLNPPNAPEYQRLLDELRSKK